MCEQTNYQSKKKKKKTYVYTKDAGHKAEGELRGKEREEPRRGVEARADLVLLKVVVQLTVIVVQQPGELVHLNLHTHINTESGQNMLRQTGMSGLVNTMSQSNPGITSWQANFYPNTEPFKYYQYYFIDLLRHASRPDIWWSVLFNNTLVKSTANRKRKQKLAQAKIRQLSSFTISWQLKRKQVIPSAPSNWATVQRKQPKLLLTLKTLD